jgi:stress-induced-phosphoprotein 1
LIKDPRIQQTLKELQENPAAAQSALSDPFIANGINKLIAAGVIKTG